MKSTEYHSLAYTGIVGASASFSIGTLSIFIPIGVKNVEIKGIILNIDTVKHDHIVMEVK